MKDKYRVAVCKDTGWKVVQVTDEAEGWLCLHNETEAEDEKAVEVFLTKGEII